MLNLLEPFKLTPALTLKNRIVMAPMTRVNATPDFAPTKAMQDYYARRADAGLIITEGTIIAANARGHDQVPGIFTKEQIQGWKNITAAVHAKGGHIFQQIWHVGRVSHPHFLNGELPVAPSATSMSGRVNRSADLTYGAARELSPQEIDRLVMQYKTAAENAIAAGFDGVELHGANGYLIDQFLHHATNQRRDEFGGTAENMARFPLLIVRAIGESIGYQKLGLRLSPGAYLNEITTDRRDGEVFRYLLAELNSLALAYVHTGNFNDAARYGELDDHTMSEFIRQFYRGTLIGCGSYTINSAEKALAELQFDLIAFGRLFIANPDLIQKIQHQLPLTAYDASMLASLI